MENNMTTIGEALAASQEATLVIELFLNENYRFRGFKHKEHCKRLCLYALCHCPIVATFAPMYQKMYSYGVKERL